MIYDSGPEIYTSYILLFVKHLCNYCATENYCGTFKKEHMTVSCGIF